MTRYVVGLGSGILRFCVNPAVAGEWALSAIGLALSQVPWVSHLGHPTLAAAHARPAVFWAYATVHSVFSCARRHRASSTRSTDRLAVRVRAASGGSR